MMLKVMWESNYGFQASDAMFATNLVNATTYGSYLEITP